MIEAANRAYLVAYRRNAKLMALMEQVAQIDEDFRRMRLRRVRAFTERNAQAIAQLQQRGLADPEPRSAARRARRSARWSARMAYCGTSTGSEPRRSETLARHAHPTLGGALGIPPSKPRR